MNSAGVKYYKFVLFSNITEGLTACLLYKLLDTI